MAEELEGLESGAGASAAGIDPAAVALALGGASREDANAFLRDQRKLIALQAKDLSQEQDLRHWSMLVRHTSSVLKLTLEFCVGLLLLALAAGLALLIWDASQSSGLVIEPFSVPPDMAARGITGQVIAAEVLDHILAMEAQTVSQRAPKSYANSWSQEDLKIDIPETGLSLSQLDNFLRTKLGHDTHVTGEIVRSSTGLNLTVRAGVAGADRVGGTEDNLDALVQHASESVYRLTQPYRYGVFLNSNNRIADSVAVFQAVAASGSAQERAWGYNGWHLSVLDSDGIDVAYGLARQGLALAPDNFLLLSNLSGLDAAKSRPERALRDARTAASLLSGNGHGMLRPELVTVNQTAIGATMDYFLGAFHEAARGRLAVGRSSNSGAGNNRTSGLMNAQIGEHDLAAARFSFTHRLAEVTRSPGQRTLYLLQAKMKLDSQAQDWARVMDDARAIDALAREYAGMRSFLPTVTVPLVAHAQAMSGNIAEAEAQIAATPADCDDCQLTRARIAALRGQAARADYWFDRAEKDAPSIPLADAAWGDALLARGQPDAAIEKFKLSNRKGPHFADPLEMWGEALMAKNQSHLALAKFAEAEKYAPNWGRLHLKWGEALVYAGKSGEAKTQFTAAAALDLTPSEKTELARHL